MMDDAELLRCYADSRDEAAFAKLVQRRIGLVYSVALRRTRDAHRAEDVTQVVFTALARKAAILARRPVLVGWLCRSAQFAANDADRAEARRQAREQEAYTMEQLVHDEPEPDWNRLRPVLDEVLNDMDERDRDAVLLRFFDGQPFAEIGAKLRLTENAARMRVERALEKMHTALARRGITSTATGLGLALVNQSTAAVPANLVASVAQAAMASAAAGAGTAGILTFMSATKLQIGIAGLLIAGATTMVVWQQDTDTKLREELQTHRGQQQQIAAMREENQRLRRAAIEVESLRVDEAELTRLRNEDAKMQARVRAARTPTAAWNGQPLYEIGQLDQAPKSSRETQARPAYPEALRKSGTTGSATVSLIVDASGHVNEVTAIESTHEEFGAAAVAAVRKWTFTPGQKDGQPVNVRLPISMSFTTSDPNLGNPKHWW